ACTPSDHAARPAAGPHGRRRLLPTPEPREPPPGRGGARVAHGGPGGEPGLQRRHRVRGARRGAAHPTRFRRREPHHRAHHPGLGGALPHPAPLHRGPDRQQPPAHGQRHQREPGRRGAAPDPAVV
ncbi:MAG: hypothetical protein AVDCRST_MAG40-3174, partial [uncultured Gemmatimonadaceae bacterium]